MQPSMRGQLITCDYFAKIRLVVGSCVADMKLKASRIGLGWPELGWAGLLQPPASSLGCFVLSAATFVACAAAASLVLLCAALCAAWSCLWWRLPAAALAGWRGALCYHAQ